MDIWKRQEQLQTYYTNVRLNMKWQKIKNSLRVLFGKEEVYFENDECAEERFDEENVLVSITSEIFYGGGYMYEDAVPYTREMTTNESEEPTQKKTKKKELLVSVKSIVNELHQNVNLYNMQGLDEKIALMNRKIDLFYEKGSDNSKTKFRNPQSRYGLRELQTFLKRLENRKLVMNKWKDGKTFKDFYDAFPATEERNIHNLIEEYGNLDFKTSDYFVPDFPQDAIDVMEQYKAVTKQMCDADVRFYVLAKKEDFKLADHKRDPILFAPSPFGMFYHILGAWDEEMILLSEL